MAKSHAKLKKKSWEADIGLYERHIATRLGSHELGALKRRNVIDVLDNIATEVSGVQANRCQTLVSSVLNWALDEDLLEANPPHGVRQRGHETPRERVMTEAELRAFWNALTGSPLDNSLRLLLCLANGGMRLAEQLSANLARIFGIFRAVSGAAPRISFHPPSP